ITVAARVSDQESGKPRAEAATPRAEAAKPRAEAAKPRAEAATPRAEAAKPRAEAIPNERQRNPKPLIKRRLPSGRGALEQPNAGHDPAALTASFWLLVGVTGVLTGGFGALMMAILHGTGHIAFNYGHGSYQAATIRASGERRVVALAIGGLVTGLAWYLLRKYTKGHKADLDDSLWTGHGELSFRRGFLSSVISEVAVGSGASLGREAAPKLMGAISGSLLARWRKLSPAQQRLLVACGGGAGMAAVYNVPLGGALISAELLYGSLSLPVVMPALACSAIATATSWLFLPNQPTYLAIPDYRLSASQLVWSALVGPLIGVICVGYIRLIGWVSHHRVSGRAAALAPLAAFTVLGLVGLRYPQLFGNGKDMAHQVFLGHATLVLMFALFALKPLVTSLCLGSGATGGLFTPTLSTGAMLGGFLGSAWSRMWPGSATGSYAVVGAAAMIGAATQAPLSSLVLVLELTRTTDGLMVPMMLATALATLVARLLDGYSIYSARLPA
ncbi:MAG: chloride channel protein, partial [Mycobacteriales bacterium]